MMMGAWFPILVLIVGGGLLAVGLRWADRQASRMEAEYWRAMADEVAEWEELI